MRRAHLLRENKKCETPRRIVYFDSEARVPMNVTEMDLTDLMLGQKVEKKHTPYLVCATFSWRTNHGKRRERQVDYYGDDFLYRFWHDVDEFAKWKERTYVVAHNAKYDALVTQCIPRMTELGYTLVQFSDDNPMFMVFRKSRERTTKNGKTVTEHKTVIVFSSTNYYKTSLEQLGRTFGIQKGQHDHERGDEDMEAAIEYCRRDVLILQTAMEEFFDFVREEDLGNFSLTIAGQAFNAYRHRFMTYPIFIHDNQNALRLEREAYAGGRNECFYIGCVPEERIYGCDVNSMYPSVMKEYDYPTALRGLRALPSLSEVRKYLDAGYLMVAECYVETSIPIFHKKGEKLTFPVGRFWTTLSTPEIEEGLRRGLIKRVRRLALYARAPIFKPYVDYFYTKRLEAKSAGDKVRDMMYKLFLNSLYGKFGQKNIHWERVADADPKLTYTSPVIDEKGRRYTERVVGGGVFVLKNDPDDIEAYNSFPAVAAHVTAYARMRLWKYIETAGLSNVYYCDTDSLYVNEEGFRRLDKAGLIDERKLGLLKLERVCREMVLYGCKDYEFVEEHSGKKKVKMKGVSKSAVEIEPDEHGRKRFVVTQWVGVSEGLRKQSLEEYANRLVVKTLKREYDKGIVTPSGRVEPFRLDEPERPVKKEGVVFARREVS